MSSSRWRRNRTSAAAVLLAVSGLSVLGCGTDADTDTGDGGQGGGAAVTGDEGTTATEADAEGDAPGADGDVPTEEDEAVGAGPEAGDGVEELFPDVLGATAERTADGTWTFSATLSSPYDTAQRYADAWRVVGPDGTVYGIRELAHDHASEQPFTRSQSGITIPEDVSSVTVEGRDQISGWGGATVDVDLGR